MEGTPDPDADAAEPRFATITFRDRNCTPQRARSGHEAYLRTLDYAAEAGLEGAPMGLYVKRMTYGDYAAVTGQGAPEEILGCDIWVVALAPGR